MSFRTLVLVIATAGLTVSGCASFQVDSDFDPEADFAQYDTFTWLPRVPDTDNPIKSDDLLYKRIERAVNNNLAAKGMRIVDNEADASLLVTEHIGIEQKLRVNTTNYGYGYGHWGYYGGGYQQTQVDQYEEGTLMIDLIDAKTKQLVWRGTAQSRLQHLKTPEERNKRIREAVDAILEGYPPAKKK